MRGQEGRWKEEGKSEARSWRERAKRSTEHSSPLHSLGAQDTQYYISPRPHPGLMGLRPQTPSPGRTSCPLSDDQPSPPTRRRRGATGEMAQHPAPLEGQGETGQYQLSPFVKWGVGTDLETETGRKNQEEGTAKGTRVRRVARRCPPGRHGRPRGMFGDPLP